MSRCENLNSIKRWELLRIGRGLTGPTPPWKFSNVGLILAPGEELIALLEISAIVLLCTADAVQQEKGTEGGPELRIMLSRRNEDAVALDLPRESEEESPLTAAAPVAVACYRGHSTVSVLVSKPECLVIQEKLRGALARAQAAADSRVQPAAAVGSEAEPIYGGDWGSGGPCGSSRC